MRASLFLLASTLSAFTSATSWSNITASAFYDMIPTCVRACDVLALTQDGCAIDDFACHCANPQRIGEFIAPCIATETTCTPADLEAFAATVDDVCTYENEANPSIPWTNVTSAEFGGVKPNATTGGSWSTPAWPPVAIYTGAASSVRGAGVGAAAVVVVAMFAL